MDDHSAITDAARPAPPQPATDEGASRALVRLRGLAPLTGLRLHRGPLLAFFVLGGLTLVGCTTTGATGPSTSLSAPSNVAAPSSAHTTVTIAPGSVIDGFTLGVRVACSGPVGSVPSSVVGCGGYPQLAIEALDARDPGHAPIVATATFTDASGPGPIDVTGGASPSLPASASSGDVVTVFVFTLADGSVRATAVKCSTTGSCAGVGAPTAP
jgi:hypothetical protein